MIYYFMKKKNDLNEKKFFFVSTFGFVCLFVCFKKRKKNKIILIQFKINFFFYDFK